MATETQKLDALIADIKKRGPGCVFVMQEELEFLFALANEGARSVELREKLLAAMEAIKKAPNPKPVDMTTRY